MLWNDWQARLATAGLFAGILVAACSSSLSGAEPPPESPYLSVDTPVAGVEQTPLDVSAVPAFPELTWKDWEPVTEDGQSIPLRPIVLTHAGDGSNRLFVATQQGVIHVFDEHEQPQTSRIFLDLTDRVVYQDHQNEEGLLGLAFHPQYRKNGQLFVYYTSKTEPNMSVISRFTVDPQEPDRALPKSETVFLKIQQPAWNHNGGTIAFGPDGYLYIGMGDGGKQRDPFGNGQSLGTLLGKILRIDIDHPGDGTLYAIPSDNPYRNQPHCRPEIWSVGWRNIWRMSFDRQTGLLWAADVGESLWEEINIVTRGGNYGWSRREGRHPFGPRRNDPPAEFVDPIWEYAHDVGKSITGGSVYRGREVPSLAGKYVYGDYVSGIFWGLGYDPKSGRVISNQRLDVPRGLAVITFGESERGEVYFAVVTPTGRGLYRFREGAADPTASEATSK